MPRALSKHARRNEARAASSQSANGVLWALSVTLWWRPKQIIGWTCEDFYEVFPHGESRATVKRCSRLDREGLCCSHLMGWCHKVCTRSCEIQKIQGILTDTDPQRNEVSRRLACNTLTTYLSPASLTGYDTAKTPCVQFFFAS